MSSRRFRAEPPRAPERHAVGARQERWKEFLELEHVTLSPLTAVERDGADVLLYRGPAAARRIEEGGIPRAHARGLLLQAAGAIAFFESRGFPLHPDDLRAATWDVARGDARLWLTRTPASVAEPACVPAPAAELLEPLLARLFGRGGRLETAGAREFARSLALPSASERRPEFWFAEALRDFPDLGTAAFAAARRRCLGVIGPALRSLAERTAAARAMAALQGRPARLFEVEGSALAPASALRLGAPVRGAAEATRRLRDLVGESESGPRPVWIASDRAGWDQLSRAAFDAALLRLRERVEVVRIDADVPMPEGPDGWRRALWLPGGTLSGSVRLFEWFANLGLGSGADARQRALDVLASPGFATFVADPTGDAPLPRTEGDRPLGDELREPREDPAGPAGRIERSLARGLFEDALEHARSWIRSEPDAKPEAWFTLSSRLSARAGEGGAPWLESLEAEREIAGGRPREALARLERLGRRTGADDEDLRRAGLRAAEVAVMVGETSSAARKAAAWRREHPEAPAGESVRALRLGAAGLAREGRADCALALLDEADGIGAGLGPVEAVETGMVRAQVHARAGRHGEEDRVYESLRSRVAEARDERLAARFLAQQARGLLDRREYGRALLRIDEALASVEDDPGEHAALSIDRAAILYHAGRPSESEAALERAVASAAAAGREDLVRIARGNRIELLLDRTAFEAAESEIADAVRRATEDRDERRLLVALHQRSRLSLRRGDLDAAGRDNAEARRLADHVRDATEIGELWLEEGDRLAYRGDRDGARLCWTRAAEDLPDRCDTAGLARRRLAELDRDPGARVSQLDGLFAADPFRAAETVARACGLHGRERIPEALRERAAATLRGAGARGLADLTVARGSGAPPEERLRALRGAIAGVISGDGAGAARVLPGLGLEALLLRDAEGREIARLGQNEPASRAERWRALDAGAAQFELALEPDPPEETVRAIVLLLETLLYRSSAEPVQDADFAEGWRRIGLVTADAAMREPYLRLLRFAPQPVTVLVLGESGSGKEAVARAVHRLSPRSAGPFVSVNLPAIPAALAESELFGHARGAFTGADRERRGLLEEAHGGTIFFDEIGDLPAALQAKLLRALQEREVRRVGENRPRPVDARVVSATSRDLVREVETGRFREDLFYRLHVAVVRLPPLRERGRDALRLARFFLDRCAREYGRGPLRISPEASAAILAYGWPGNVRELQNAIAQAAALCDAGGVVGPDLLPEPVRGAGGRRREPAGDYRARVDAHRRALVRDALDRHGGNRSRAARDLGLSRQALLYLIRELRVESR
jgi:DNA-binding NtrC family response regulator/tetratricopeptide (TPR) repeat protein